MPRTLWAFIFLLFAPTLVLGQSQAPGQPKKLNVIIILCDDLGYGDLGCYGHPMIRTPNLDKLAKKGTRFTQCYAAAPVCSPSRAGILTGRIPSRSGIYSWIAENNPMYLLRQEITLATLLREAGYRTAQIGKWHLNGFFNSKQQTQPGDHGFDHWFSTQNNAIPSHQDPKNFVRNGKAVGPLEGFSCQLVVDEAIAWLKAGRDSPAPFFLHVCFHEPHEPVASPADLVASYPKAKNEDEAQYFANVTNMDAAVGRLLAALEEMGQADNTVVFFTSDNGPETLNRYPGARRSYGLVGLLRGRKLWLYEGGIRVPGILYWPGKTPPGQSCDEPLWSLDLLPTFCRAFGAKVPTDRAIDGSDFLPALAGKKIDRKTPLFWHYYRSLGEPRVAMRDGDWVILARCDPSVKGAGATLQKGDMEVIKNAKLTGYELYNLRDDLSQTKDVAPAEPERLKQMSQRLVALYREVIAEGPTWMVADPTPDKRNEGYFAPPRSRSCSFSSLAAPRSSSNRRT
jgi:arylsulfatase A